MMLTVVVGVRAQDVSDFQTLIRPRGVHGSAPPFSL
jgi:hypothetical protein